jgi:hypothetical protein
MQQMQLSMGRTLKMPQNVSLLQNPKMGRSIQNLNGQQFGRLTVLGFCGVIPCGQVDCRIWLTKCSCGNFVMLNYTSLIRGLTKSCGCLHKDIVTDTLRNAHLAEYSSYSCAKTRCRNANVKHYKHYGGRGIEFRFASFEEFFNELGERPTADHSLNRIDNDGHYEKGNVEWATTAEQMNNRQDTIYLTIDGESQTIRDWATNPNSVSPELIRSRIASRWCHQCAIFNPVKVVCEHKSRLF